MLRTEDEAVQYEGQCVMSEWVLSKLIEQLIGPLCEKGPESGRSLAERAERALSERAERAPAAAELVLAPLRHVGGAVRATPLPGESEIDQIHLPTILSDASCTIFTTYVAPGRAIATN